MQESCRRVRRSSVTPVALELLLEAELQRMRAAHANTSLAVTLGTFDGKALAGVGDVAPARIAKVAARKLAGVEDALVASFRSEPFHISVVELPGGWSLLLTAVGAKTPSREVEAGVRRILS